MNRKFDSVDYGLELLENCNTTQFDEHRHILYTLSVDCEQTEILG